MKYPTSPLLASSQQHLCATSAITKAAIRRCLSLLTITLAVLGTQNILADTDVYKWVDEAGNVHYGEQPPEKKALSEEVEIIKTHKDLSSDAQGQRKERTEIKMDIEKKSSSDPLKQAEKQIEDRKKLIEAGCKTAYGNLNVLTNHGRVKEKGDNGQDRYLSDEEHMARVKEVTDYIKQNCE